MKKTVVCSLLVGTLLSGGVGATEMFDAGQGVQRWQGGGDQALAGAVHDTEGWAGGAIGAVAGALVAGPPGFIVGAAGGVLVERNGTLESDQQALRQEVALLRKRQSSQRHQVRELRRQLGELEQARQRQLQTLAGAVVYNIRFRTDRARPEPADLAQLKRLASVLKTIQQLQVTLRAHTDLRGSEDHNQRLSENRARVVKELLIEAGVASQRIRTRPEGETAAHYLRDDPEGLGFDRRVEVIFHYGEEQ